MCAVFLAGSRRLQLGQEFYDPLIVSLCYLTAKHIESRPLRETEFQNYHAVETELVLAYEQRTSNRRSAVRKSRMRGNSVAAASTSSRFSFVPRVE
jgi:hypothetical protein